MLIVRQLRLQKYNTRAIFPCVRWYSYITSSDSESEDERPPHFPYLFMNKNRGLVQKAEETSEERIRTWSIMIARDNHKVGIHFARMYKALLRAVSKNDLKTIDSLCEKSLASEWKEGLDWIKTEGFNGL